MFFFFFHRNSNIINISYLPFFCVNPAALLSQLDFPQNPIVLWYSRSEHSIMFKVYEVPCVCTLDIRWWLYDNDDINK